LQIHRTGFFKLKFFAGHATRMEGTFCFLGARPCLKRIKPDTIIRAWKNFIYALDKPSSTHHFKCHEIYRCLTVGALVFAGSAAGADKAGRDFVLQKPWSVLLPE